MIPTQAANSAVPITPREIAEDCAVCLGLGASTFHLHARDEAGQPSWRPDIYREIVLAVRIDDEALDFPFEQIQYDDRPQSEVPPRMPPRTRP